MQLPEDIVIFDLETTDGALGPHEIIEVGAIHISKHLEIGLGYSSVVRPAHPEWVSPYITELTGITREEVEAAQPWDEQWKEFGEFTHYNHKTLGAWGAYFDIPVLRQNYTQYNLGYPHRGRAWDIKSFVGGLFTYWGLKPKSWGLNAVCKHFEIENPKAHRALSDAETTAKLLKAVINYSLELNDANSD
jgi:DNA polymerase III epsilon subunit-like protein